jgi:hypothetical protein
MFIYELSKDTLNNIDKIADLDARLSAFNEIIHGGGEFKDNISIPKPGDCVTFASMYREAVGGFFLKHVNVYAPVKDFVAAVFCYLEEEDVIDVSFMKKEYIDSFDKAVVDITCREDSDIVVIVYCLRFLNNPNSAWVVCDVPGSPFRHNDNAFKLLFNKKYY